MYQSRYIDLFQWFPLNINHRHSISGRQNTLVEMEVHFSTLITDQDFVTTKKGLRVGKCTLNNLRQRTQINLGFDNDEESTCVWVGRTLGC